MPNSAINQEEGVCVGGVRGVIAAPAGILSIAPQRTSRSFLGIILD